MIILAVLALAALAAAPMRAQSISYAPEPITVSCSPGSELIGVLDVYSQTCTASGGDGTYSWVVSGMPRGFSKSEDTGSPSVSISGIPYNMTSQTIIVTAMDTSTPPRSGTNTMTLEVQAGITAESSQ
jgi:hypothetical protein